ncbi:hypothetical protein NDU88_003405 [Pleurodeles waltl]|uniref:Secreted protein n=1 Tax=Pleurodeles waltl TaxID=8319 RepID=A0AAV7UYC4_PLEWA|nr:hypothetical protein NDU88_003405 [Pleurodeles waltl]
MWEASAALVLGIFVVIHRLCCSVGLSELLQQRAFETTVPRANTGRTMGAGGAHGPKSRAWQPAEAPIQRSKAASVFASGACP